MKSCSIVFSVSSLLILQAVTAAPGLGLRKYFQSSSGNVKSYRLRDTVPANSKNTNASPITGTDDVDVTATVRPQKTESLKANEQFEGVPSTTNNIEPADERDYANKEADIENTPQTTPVNDVDANNTTDTKFPTSNASPITGTDNVDVTDSMRPQKTESLKPNEQFEDVPTTTNNIEPADEHDYTNKEADIENTPRTTPVNDVDTSSTTDTKLSTSNPSPITDTDNVDVTDTVKPQRTESVRPDEQFEGVSTANNVEPEDERDYANEQADFENLSQTTQVNNMDTKLPTYEEYSEGQGDGSFYNNVEPSDDDGDEVTQNAVSQPALTRIKEFSGLTTILANIARIPQSTALQIDTEIGGLQSKYPVNTNVGAYLMGTRYLLRNQGALRPFVSAEQAGLPQFYELVSSMPSVFNPIFNAMDRLADRIRTRAMAAFQRLNEAARRVNERVDGSLAGIDVTRGDDSYDVSVPNLIDMVLKGRLVEIVDELFAYVQRLVSAGLDNMGSSFSTSNSVSEEMPTMETPVATKKQSQATGTSNIK